MTRHHFVILLAVGLIQVHCAYETSNHDPVALQAVPGLKPLPWPPDLLKRFLDAAKSPQIVGNPDVDGACTSIAIAGPRQIEQLKFDIYVREDKAREYRVPDLPGIPKEAIRVRLVSNDGFFALGPKMGTSTSTGLGCSVGTLGIAAEDRKDPTVRGYITCDHVAASSSGCFGGMAVDQVAPGNCERPHCVSIPPIGQRLCSALISNLVTTNEVDAAFVQSNDVDPENDCGFCWNGQLATPADILGKPVRKCGRTSWFTCGVVTGIGCTVNIRYRRCAQEATFINQIRIEGMNGTAFARPGDSGAAVFSANGEAVGLLFGGNGDGGIAWANPMRAVLSALDVSLLPAETCPKQPECLERPRRALRGCPGFP